MLTLCGAALIDGTGADPVSDSCVTIEGQRIKTVAAKEYSVDPVAHRVELDGLTLLPGLIDLHTHLGALDLEGDSRTPVSMVAAQLFRNAELCLMSGHTAVRELGGADRGLASAIDAGLVRGPRLFPSGPLLCQSGGHGDLASPYADYGGPLACPGLTQFSVACDGPDDVRRAARLAFKRGATQLKMSISGGVVSLTDNLEDVQFTVGEMKAAVSEAHARGTYVTAHAHSPAAILQGLEAGLECFEHGTLMDEHAAARMAEAGAALVPTLTVGELMLEEWEEWGVPAEVLPRARRVREAMYDAVSIAREAGVLIGSGSDLLGPEQNRRGLEMSLKAKVLGPMEAIVAATRSNATILRQDRHLGIIEEGKIADIIAVSGDPLSEPELLDDPDRVVMVIKDGEIVKDIRS